MLTSRTIVTFILVIAVGVLGWVGGSRFHQHGEIPEIHSRDVQHPSEQRVAHREHDDLPADRAHGGKTDSHAGHGHGEQPDPAEICAEHRMPEAEDVLCNPQLMTALLPGEGVKMRLATPGAAERAGIVIVRAKKTGIASGPAVPARVTYNRSRLADVMALSGGMVRRIVAEPGQRVGMGEVLAEIASPGAALARADYQAAMGQLGLAEANVRREQDLVGKGVSARMELEQAEAELQAARASVEQLRERLAAFGATTSAGGGGGLAVRSPLAGTVVARSAVTGQSLTPETPLFTIADLASMWIELQLSADQIPLVTVGTAVEAEFDGIPGQDFQGRIVLVETGLDERTRLLRAVAEIANRDGLLKDGMFGRARVVTGVAQGHDSERHESMERERGHGSGHDGDESLAGDSHGPPVAVPTAAVQAIDGKAYVFVAYERDLFELRRVEAGPRRADEILIVAGLKDGEQVAASQGFALKSELLKSRLGASCADH